VLILRTAMPRHEVTMSLLVQQRASSSLIARKSHFLLQESAWLKLCVHP
jgi:hypothetical protein